MEIAEVIGNRIIELCSERDLSINKLAKLSNVAVSTIDNIVNGRCSNPRIFTIKKICEGFGMSVIEFFDFEGFKK